MRVIQEADFAKYRSGNVHWNKEGTRASLNKARALLDQIKNVDYDAMQVKFDKKYGHYMKNSSSQGIDYQFFVVTPVNAKKKNSFVKFMKSFF